MSGKQPPDNFNPYHKWLGIPQQKCPPTFYELLGISLDEEDRSVIESAAERQRSHVEQYLGTEWNKYANQIISQIEEAEVTLLSPDLRREYDRKVNLFKKRRKKRQVDPITVSGSSMLGGTRVVGEGSGLAREYAGIVSVLAVAFFGMAAASFWLPWGKLLPDSKANIQAEAEAVVVDESRPENVNTDRESPENIAEETTDMVMNAEEPEEPLFGVGIQFKRLLGGTFMMGEKGNRGRNTPLHAVTISKPFEIGIHEVTQKQYEAVMGTNPSQHKGPDNPVDSIGWNDAVEFCQKLSAMLAEKAAGNIYRLPTEAEWEYACRAGTSTKFCFGDDESQLVDDAWFKKTARSTSHPVGQKEPNLWGIYDMHGSVYEWCQDYYAPYQAGPVTDPRGGETGSHRVLRGGGFTNISSYCRSAERSYVTVETIRHSYGFRVVRERGNKGAGVLK